MRQITHQDLHNFRFMSNPRLSPDGTKVVYQVSRTNLEKNKYDTCLWLYDLTTKTNRQLTEADCDRKPTWNLDGTEVIFATSRDKTKIEDPIVDSPRETRFYSIKVNGGEAKKLFVLPLNAFQVTQLDQHRYLFLASIPRTKDNPEGANYYRTNELPFAANGEGFIQPERCGLHLYDANDQSIQRLTEDCWDVSSYCLSPDNKRVLMVADRFEDARPLNNHVIEYHFDRNTTEHLNRDLYFSFIEARYTSQGEIMVLGSNMKKTGCNENSKFYLLKDHRLIEKTPTLDTSVHSSVGCDLRYGGGNHNSFLELDGSIIYVTTHGYQSNLFALQNDGLIRQLTDFNAVDDFDISNGALIFTAHQKNDLANLYLLKGSNVEKLTNLNGELLNELDLAQPERVSVDNGEGLMLDGWILRPTDFDPNKKYPSILHIHGGPKTVFGETLFHEMQCWAAQGFIVYYCNPRGGDGRPNGFDDIRGHYGDWDYKDLMAFTDWVIEHEPAIDRTKMGVTGGSYGGYMTNWIVGQTDRFAAACAQRPISNWVSKFGSSDIGFYFVPDQHGGGTLWENLDQWWNDSPLKYACNVKTPLLLIQSIDDFRCELTQSTQMFTALKTRGVPCEMCLFIGENHELSRSGKPKERLARLREISTWFKRWLQ